MSVTIRDIIMLHDYLASIKDPDQRTKDARDKVLDHLLLYVEAMREMRPVLNEVAA